MVLIDAGRPAELGRHTCCSLAPFVYHKSVKWIIEHLNISFASLLISFVSLWISVLAVRHAKRSADAATRGAAAAEEQAVAAADQVSEARTALAEAKESSRLMQLENARARFNSQAPMPVLCIEPNVSKPLVLRAAKGTRELLSRRKPYPHPPIDSAEEPRVLDYWDNRWDDIYCIVRGTIKNDGPQSMRVLPSGPVFIEDATVLFTGELRKPPRIHPSYQCYLLGPGETALFEWRATNTLDAWVDLHEGIDNAIRVSAEFTCLPGSYDEGITRVILRCHDNPLYPIAGTESVVLRPSTKAVARKWKVAERNLCEISISIDRDYLQDTRRLRASLTGEIWDGLFFSPPRPDR